MSRMFDGTCGSCMPRGKRLFGCSLLTCWSSCYQQTHNNVWSEIDASWSSLTPYLARAGALLAKKIALNKAWGIFGEKPKPHKKLAPSGSFPPLPVLSLSHTHCPSRPLRSTPPDITGLHPSFASPPTAVAPHRPSPHVSAQGDARLWFLGAQAQRLGWQYVLNFTL